MTVAPASLITSATGISYTVEVTVPGYIVENAYLYLTLPDEISINSAAEIMINC
jgi:hypothetical protein